MADKRFGTYYKLLADVLRDLKVTEAELAYVKEKQVELELLPEQVKAIHAKVFAAAIIPMIDDDFLDPMEEDKLSFGVGFYGLEYETRPRYTGTFSSGVDLGKLVACATHNEAHALFFFRLWFRPRAWSSTSAFRFFFSHFDD